MRSIVAIVMIVLGLGLGVLGILQKTVWAPPETIVASAKTTETDAAAVIEPGVLDLYQGGAVVTVEGNGDLTVGQASKVNVDAWVEGSNYLDITGLKTQEELRTKQVEGDSDSLPNPAGADLWEESTTEADTVTYTWKDQPADHSLLIGSKVGGPLKVSVEWKNPPGNPWPTILMVLGVIFLIIGIRLFISGTRAQKREKERIEARRERRKRLAQVGSAFAIVPALSLAGCGQGKLPEPPEYTSPATPAASITDNQLQRILEQVSETVAAADKKRDAKKLESRAAGTFFEQRKDAYKIKQKDKKAALPAVPETDEVKVNFTSATGDWPRVTSAVVSGKDQTQLVVLSQDNARSNYKLWALTVLVPGAEFPEVEDARVGSELLPVDQDGLAMTPQATVANYIDKLQNPKKSKHKDAFEDDAFAKQEQDSYNKLKKEIDKGNGTTKRTYKAGKQLVAQSTADGSAIVVGEATQTLSVTPESKDGQTGELTIPTTQAKVLGKEKTSQTLSTAYHQVYAFAVPKSGEGKPRLIGVSTSMSGAKLSGN